MSKTQRQAALEGQAAFFKALGHPVRLLILNLVKAKPRHGEELAAILNLQPATISHHLNLLTAAGLLTAQKDQYYQTYSLVGATLDHSLAEMVFLSQPAVSAEVQEDAYRKKVLDTFFRNGRLLQIPAQMKKWQIVLERLVEEFEPGREYSEAEVNRILLEFNEDVASLRRGMIEMELMERSRGIYRRVEN